MQAAACSRDRFATFEEDIQILDVISFAKKRLGEYAGLFVKTFAHPIEQSRPLNTPSITDAKQVVRFRIPFSKDIASYATIRVISCHRAATVRKPAAQPTSRIQGRFCPKFQIAPSTARPAAIGMILLTTYVQRLARPPSRSASNCSILAAMQPWPEEHPGENGC
jgi:hypothetical protein